jgi:GGDEF domain-containing protein
VSDVYGFDRAGEFLVALGAALSGAALRASGPTPAIGHIGGDDFLVICEPDQMLPFTKHAVTAFEQAADQLYDPYDARRGYVIFGRRSQRAALVTLSIGGIDIRQAEGGFHSFRDLATTVSEMKRIAKTQPGSYVAIDRRTHPPPEALQEVQGSPAGDAQPPIPAMA